MTSLVYGMKTLTQSAELAGEQSEEPSAFEKKVAKLLHMKEKDVMIAVALVLAIVLSIALFFALPTGIEAQSKLLIPDNEVALNLIGGVVRISVFLLYVYLCSKLKEIRLWYHGAEHKSIFCFEAGGTGGEYPEVSGCIPAAAKLWSPCSSPSWCSCGTSQNVFHAWAAAGAAAWWRCPGAEGLARAENTLLVRVLKCFA